MFLRRKSQAGRPGRKRGRGKNVVNWLLIGTTSETDTQGSFKVLIFMLTAVRTLHPGDSNTSICAISRIRTTGVPWLVGRGWRLPVWMSRASQAARGLSATLMEGQFAAALQLFARVCTVFAGRTGRGQQASAKACLVSAPEGQSPHQPKPFSLH